jgi:mono/diheme cytochrome c family protein
MSISVRLAILLSLIFVIVACAQTPVPAPPLPTATSTQIAGVTIPNLEQGQAAWNQAQCPACHGPVGLGGIGPQLAATKLSYEKFLQVVRTAVPPKPAYTAEQLPDQAVFDIYAWVRTQIPMPDLSKPDLAGPSPSSEPSPKDMMSMAIWTNLDCYTCHGIFAQGSSKGPTLAGINDPVEDELARMRASADKIHEHSADHISDEIFQKLYEWIKMGCVRDECYQ